MVAAGKDGELSCAVGVGEGSDELLQAELKTTGIIKTASIAFTAMFFKFAIPSLNRIAYTLEN